MTVLLSLGDSELGNTCANEVLGHSIGDLGRAYKVLRGDVKVAVVLEHTCVNYLGNANSVELVELCSALKCLGDLDGTVATEVEEDNAVAILDSADGLAVLCNYERGEILVNDLGLISVGGDSLLCGCELSALTENVSLPACLNHTPVSLVSVHGDLHTAAARCDSDVEAIVAEVREILLEGTYIIKCAGLANVTTVEKNVYSYLCYSVALCSLDESLEVIDMRMNVTVREKTEEMEGGGVILYARNERAPGIRGEDLAGLDGLRNELRTLCKNLSRAKRIVAYLGVTHIVIAGETYGCAVSLDSEGGILLHNSVKGGSMSGGNRVSAVVGSDAYAVHNDGEKRTFNTCKLVGFVELCHCSAFLYMPFLLFYQISASLMYR